MTLLFSEIVAIGDGSNDLEMLKHAGLGIGYHAHDIIKNNIERQIIFNDLTTVLYFLGIKKQNFVKDNTLNELLNETAQGDTNTQTAMAPVNDPFSTSGVVPTEAMPAKIANVVNRDYRSLMKAIDKKKGN